MADDCTKKLIRELEKYTDDITDGMADLIDDVSEEAVEQLEEKSPKRTGKYSKNWKVRNLNQVKAKKLNVVYNAKRYQLTHLLEHGHRNAATGGMVPAYPHIAEVEQYIIKELQDRTEQLISK